MKKVNIHTAAATQAMLDLPANHRIQVTHLHPNNSTKHQRRGCPYVTIATVYFYAATGRVVICHGVARCSPKDQPNRKLGYVTAVKRAMRALADRVPVVDGDYIRPSNARPIKVRSCGH